MDPLLRREHPNIGLKKTKLASQTRRLEKQTYGGPRLPVLILRDLELPPEPAHRRG